jgi:hypothetical protein
MPRGCRDPSRVGPLFDHGEAFDKPVYLVLCQRPDGLVIQTRQGAQTWPLKLRVWVRPLGRQRPSDRDRAEQVSERIALV